MKRVSETSATLGRRFSTRGMALISCVAVASVFVTLVATPAAQARSETVLYTFTGPRGAGGDGAAPISGLVWDAKDTFMAPRLRGSKHVL
jgi:hypothetical protein